MFTKESPGYFFCANGHVFPYGTEEWHYEGARGHINGAPVPGFCPVDLPNGDPCMDSSVLVGPGTEEWTTAQRDRWVEANKPAEIKILRDAPIVESVTALDDLPRGTIIRAVGSRSHHWTDDQVSAPVAMKGKYEYWGLLGAGRSYENARFLLEHISNRWQVID